MDDLSATTSFDGATSLAILAALAVVAEPHRIYAGCHAEGRSLVTAVLDESVSAVDITVLDVGECLCSR